MNPRDMARQRLAQQLLTQGARDRPDQVVAWLGAVQAQDYAGAKWGLAQRAAGPQETGFTDAALDQVFADGAILRTHLLRPTWHFVTPADIRWLLALTGPRVSAGNAHRYRQLELDEDTLNRGDRILEQALLGGRHLTRPELVVVLEQSGISTEGQRMPYLLMHAELNGVICSGPRQGKQFTYTLLEERVPPAPKLDREEALTELTRRYFRTRGPATVQDFAWWSGLTVADIRVGLDLLRSEIVSTEFERRTYWHFPDGSDVTTNGPVAHLLPSYDEYFIGYADRSAMIAPGIREPDATLPEVFNNVLIVDGLVVGMWRRTLKRDRVSVEVRWGVTPTGAEREAVAAAAGRYGAFLELPVVLAEEGT